MTGLHWMRWGNTIKSCWRRGEAYFAARLLDFDLASNNGGWQWAAGTGTDAQPYFRVFNPQSQTEKFDPELKYIRKWVPEYGTPDYPDPIVEHKMARLRAINTYKKALDGCYIHILLLLWHLIL